MTEKLPDSLPTKIDAVPGVLKHVSPFRWLALPVQTDTRFVVPMRVMMRTIVGDITPAHEEAFGRALDRLLEARLVIGVMGSGLVDGAPGVPWKMALTKVCGGEESGCRTDTSLVDFLKTGEPPKLDDGEFFAPGDSLLGTIHTARCPQTPRWLLGVSLYSLCSNEELNAAAGVPAFVEEGLLPPEWPT